MSIFISLLPIFCLLLFLIVLKSSASKASFFTFCLTAFLGAFYFGIDIPGLYTSIISGLSLAFFIVMIICGAIYLYNLVQESGALDVISKNISIIVEDSLLQFLLLCWVFTAFLQGFAGFGVPVVIVAAILKGMGYDPVKSAAAALIGHSWAISFGSMGSSIYAINMVTHTDISDITIWMVFFGGIAMFLTGLSVCLIHGGVTSVRKGFLPVALVSLSMSGALFGVISNHMYSLAGFLTAAAGLAVLLLTSRLLFSKTSGKALYKANLNIIEAALPYALIVFFSLLFFYLDLALSILQHPFVIIFIASVFSIIYYMRKKALKKGSIKIILKNTAQKCGPTALTLAFLLSMTGLMRDSGMITHIAGGLVGLTGELYPFFGPYIGLLGAFITGTTTNSNVIFGSLQETAANALGFNAAIICAAQSVGASVGCAVGPTTVTLGAASVELQGQEYKIYKTNIIPVLCILFILGVANYIINTI